RSALTWESAHEGEGVLRIGSEAVMPTGDGNLIEMLATLHFRIREPRQYLLEVSDPDEVLRSNFETVLRESAAGGAFLELLTQRRGEFQREVLATLQKRLETYGPGGLGVTLESVSLRDLHPPEQVVSAFHDVAKAAEQHDREIKDAEAEALKTRRTAEADAVDLERKAQADANRTLQQAARDRDAFMAWRRGRTDLSPEVESQLLSETIGRILGGQDMASALAEYKQRREDRLLLQAFLTDFRLSWDVLAQTLGKRDKVFIDAENLPGRRTLLLFGPEQLTPPPVIIPNRMSGRETRDEGP